MTTSGSFPFAVVPLSNMTSSGFHQAYYNRTGNDVQVWARFSITPQLPNSPTKFRFSAPPGLPISPSFPVFGQWTANGQSPCLWHLHGLVNAGGPNYLLCNSDAGALQTNAMAGEVQVFAKYVTGS